MYHHLGLNVVPDLGTKGPNVGTPERRPAPVGNQITLVMYVCIIHLLHDMQLRKCLKQTFCFKSQQVPADLVDKLERLALVDFRTKEGLVCLQRAIRFADQLHVVDTSGVEPMDSVLEHG